MKPFLFRKCGSCRERSIASVVIDYRAEVGHDGRTYPIVLPALEVLRCSLCGAIVLDDEAGDKVSDALRRAAGLLFPEQIRRGRESLGLTQKQLAQKLQVGESTLSRWETGGQIQQRSLDRLMRIYFQVPEARRFLESAEFLPTGLDQPAPSA